ncbi:MAG: tetratricopeptide repeat protein [Balneola sp.]|jgi:TolB-like protein/Tfp pilus assembly protein PilF
MNISKFIEELKRRNVFKVATAYAIAGWLIIQVVSTVSPQLGFPEWVAPFFTVLVLVGFPLSLIFAWAFELTPEGLKKSQEVDITESVTNRTGKKLNGVIITVLSMAVIFLLIERVFFAEASFIENQSELAEFQTASIAVLPFVNMSGDKDNEYFSDGLSEELLNALAKVNEMKVAGRTSSFKFKGKNEDLKIVGEQLGVGHILEGSVRKSGGRVRITAQLIKVDDGFHMWSETFDRELTATNIFEIQEEISRTVLSELKVHLLPEDDSELDNMPTTDVEGYSMYLKANQLVVNRDIDEINIAIDLYKQALKIDPFFAEAHARLAIAYNLQGFYGNISREQEIENMTSHVDQALLLDNNLGEAYAALGLLYNNKSDFVEAEKAYLKSLELNPNLSDVYNWLGNLYTDDLNEFQKGNDLYKRMYKVDPLSPLSIYNRARASMNEDKYEEALSFHEKNKKINPEFVPTYLGLAFLKSDSHYGRLDEAFMAVHKAYQLDNNFTRSLNIMVTRALELDLEPVARYYMDILKRNYPESLDYLNRAGTFASYTDDYSYVEQDMLPNVERSDWVPNPAGFYWTMTDYAIYKKEPQIALDWFAKFDSSFLNPEDLVLNLQNAWHTQPLRTLYEFTGEAEKANLLLDKFCAFSKANVDTYPQKEEGNWYLFDQVSCLMEKEKINEVIPIMTTLYLERNNRGGEFRWLKKDEKFQKAMEHPEFKKIMDIVFADLKMQRENLITYLKEEGDWNEEWEVEN